MSERSSFFNSVGGDRLYDASDFAEFFRSLFINGVFSDPATNMGTLQVTNNADMTVTVTTGEAWINGYHYVNDADLVLTIEVADGVLNRIDRIALRMDVTDRRIVAIVKKGELGSTPVAPVLLRDVDGYELGFADVYVGAGVASIVAANITDLRANMTYCGWVDMALSGITAAGRALIDDVNAAAQRVTLGAAPLAPAGATYTPATGAQTVALNVTATNMHVVSGHASGTAITFTVTGATNNQPFVVSILQGGTTVSTITAWFATIRWAGGTAPTLTATLNKRDTFGFIRTGANTYDGFVIGQNA